MNEELRQSILDVCEQLGGLQRHAESLEGRFLLECAIDLDNEMANIEGNTVGLIYFAYQLLSLAANEVRGAHAHFDSFDEDDELVPDRLIVYKWFPE